MTHLRAVVGGCSGWESCYSSATLSDPFPCTVWCFSNLLELMLTRGKVAAGRWSERWQRRGGRDPFSRTNLFSHLNHTALVITDLHLDISCRYFVAASWEQSLQLSKKPFYDINLFLTRYGQVLTDYVRKFPWPASSRNHNHLSNSVLVVIEGLKKACKNLDANNWFAQFCVRDLPAMVFFHLWSFVSLLMTLTVFHSGSLLENLCGSLCVHLSDLNTYLLMFSLMFYPQSLERKITGLLALKNYTSDSYFIKLSRCRTKISWWHCC